MKRQGPWCWRLNEKQVPGQTTFTVREAQRKEDIAEILPNLLQSESLAGIRATIATHMHKQ